MEAGRAVAAVYFSEFQSLIRRPSLSFLPFPGRWVLNWWREVARHSSMLLLIGLPGIWGPMLLCRFKGKISNEQTSDSLLPLQLNSGDSIQFHLPPTCILPEFR
ncbi:hypothetical protein NE237_002213 [Protea cynaroides]|uniref:Uncharacterized protein n=1 Tax=Protea cynaroides TaxID=273540 RepID=A0A9Q0KUJ4_9MAGN|nr:hypothetical protein NE237_002213 [Protea cynaroides]